MALAYASQPNRSRTVFYGKFNYAEMVALLAPRLFLVECGHWDGVAPDEWAVYEYAKVRRLYDTLEIDDRTDIEFFDDLHKINGERTVEFLHRHLGWTQNELHKRVARFAVNVQSFAQGCASIFRPVLIRR